MSTLAHIYVLDPRDPDEVSALPNLRNLFEEAEESGGSRPWTLYLAPVGTAPWLLTISQRIWNYNAPRVSSQACEREQDSISKSASHAVHDRNLSLLNSAQPNSARM